MNTARLRYWLNRYGKAGVLLVGGCLLGHHLWTKRRPALFAGLSIICIVVLCLCRYIFTPQAQKPLLVPANPVATILPAPKPPVSLANIKITVMRKQKNREWAYPIRAMSGSDIVWEDASYYGNAAIIPHTKIVYYADERANLVARRYDGTVVWYTPGAGGYCLSVVAGGNVVFTSASSLIWGINIYRPESWEGKEGVIGNCSVSILSGRNGKTLWDSTEYEVGSPCWTNGKVFLTLRLDVSAEAIRRVKRQKAKLPVWLELRRVDNRRRLWRQRLPGIPPGLTEVRESGKNRVAFVFTDQARYAINEFDFISHAGPMTVAVPLKNARIESGGRSLSISSQK